MPENEYRLAYCKERFSGSFEHPKIDRVKARAYADHFNRCRRELREVWLAKKRIHRYVGIISRDQAFWSDHLGIKVGNWYFQLEKERDHTPISKNFFEMRRWTEKDEGENELKDCGYTIMTNKEIFEIGDHRVHCWPLGCYHFLWNNCQNVAFDVLDDILSNPHPYHTKGVAYKLSKLRTWVIRPVVREFLDFWHCPSKVIDQYEQQIINYFLVNNNMWRSSGTPWQYDRLKEKLNGTSKPFSTLAKGFGDQVISDMHLIQAFIDFLPYIERIKNEDARVTNLRENNQKLSNQTKLLCLGPAVATGILKNVISLLILSIRHSDLFSTTFSRRALGTFEERHNVSGSRLEYIQMKISDAKNLFTLFWGGFGTWEDCYREVQKQKQYYAPRRSSLMYIKEHGYESRYSEYGGSPGHDRYYTRTGTTYVPRSEEDFPRLTSNESTYKDHAGMLRRDGYYKAIGSTNGPRLEEYYPRLTSGEPVYRDSSFTEKELFYDGVRGVVQDRKPAEPSSLPQVLLAGALILLL